MLALGLCACATSPDYQPLPPSAREESVRMVKYPSGEPRRETGYLVLPNDRRVKHGRERSWYVDGTLEMEVSYLEGELVGDVRSFWPSGAPRSVLGYGDRKTASLSRWFHANGELEAEGQALAGLKLGAWTWYYDDGTVSHAGHYLNGQRSGHWRFFRADGEPEAEGAYVRGRRVPPWTVWDERGAPEVRDYDPRQHGR